MRETGRVAAIGADLGGTNIRLALVDAEGGQIGRASCRERV